MTDPTPQAEQAKCGCGHEQEDHLEGMFACGGGWVIDDKEVNCGCDDYEPAEPSPTPPAERVIEVAPHPMKPWWDHWRPESDYPQGETRVSITYMQWVQYREDLAALTTMREERDRAQAALREFVEEWDDLAMNQLSPAYIRAMVVLAKPVSDRQPEGEKP